MSELRIGCGYDLHAFANDRPLVLGGVRIDHPRGLAGDSDADVLIHAVIDALLGAAGRGDIGAWFPPGDPTFRDARSAWLLDQVWGELRRAGWRLVNLDATVIAQVPRLAGYRAGMRQGLAECLGVGLDRISVKATSPDHLGAIGRAEGIAAQAVALLESPTTDEGARAGDA